MNGVVENSRSSYSNKSSHLASTLEFSTAHPMAVLLEVATISNIVSLRDVHQRFSSLKRLRNCFVVFPNCVITDYVRRQVVEMLQRGHTAIAAGLLCEAWSDGTVV